MMEITQKSISSVCKGFSLIELIVTIVLLGIIGVIVVPRFIGTSAFEIAAVQDALLATGRSAQQAALGRANVTFEIDEVDGDWIIEAKAGLSTIRTFEIPSSSIILETGSVVTGSTCASGLDDAITSFQLAFDALGNVDSFTYNSNPTIPVDATFNGVRICVNDTVEMSVCVSPAGYAHVGDCDD